jgi:hypothetical protein
MNYAQWRAKSNQILKQMEQVIYQSPGFYVLKSELENHLHIKPLDEDEKELEWVMSGAAPLE